jgi:hypothetical protein
MPQNYTFLKIITPVFFLFPVAKAKINYLRVVIQIVMKKFLTSLVLCAIYGYSFAQSENVDKDQYDENYEFSETKEINVSAGIGIGLDYGGIGGRLTFAPAKALALFAAIGYNLNGAGYNGGLIIRFMPDSKVCPFISAMYGYNAVIIVDGWDEVSKTYYGFSVGTGIELRMRSGNYWSFETIIPARSQKFKDDFDLLDENPELGMTPPFPILISVGYHFRL